MIKKGKKRLIAIHLPQFHQIPENDQWWGKGFTEWINVRNTKPLFFGHKQPHIPIKNHFYDLSDFTQLIRQSELAGDYGIYGFCFYHYWFNGKLLLEKPIENILKDTKYKHPYCLCWANENWTRKWDGLDDEILMKQNYSLEDDENHIKYLIQFFKDKRYITINSKPVFLIYRSELFPDIRSTTKLWREEAEKSGLSGLYLIRIDNFVEKDTPESEGFDASMLFHPQWHSFPERLKENFPQKVVRKIFRKDKVNQFIINRIYNYKDYVENTISVSRKNEYKAYPCIMPGWDNSARRKKDAVIITGSTPSLYKKWLKHVYKNFIPYSQEENLIFINAWNEWAEGNHLEPCKRWKYAYLKATKKVVAAFDF